MIDLSNIKSPGWQRAVAELSIPAADDRQFVARLLAVLGQVAGARQAVFFTLGGQGDDASPEVEARPEQIWPLAVGTQDPSRAAAMAAAGAGVVDPTLIDKLHEVGRAASAAGSSRQSRVFGIDGEQGQYYDEVQSRGYVLALPVAGGLPQDSATLPLRGVVTLLLEARSKGALQTTLALCEVLVGYVFAHAAQLALARTRQGGMALELATRLIASINHTTGFKGCCLQLVNDLCRQLGADRVALGWVHGSPGRGARREVRCQAMSDTEHLDRRLALVRKLEAAMDECMDQEQAVVYPPPGEEGPEGDALLARAVTHAHRELASSDARLRIASVPLRVSDQEGDRVVGVVLVEGGAQPGRGDAGVDTKTVELLQAALDLLAPVLVVRRSDDRNLARRALASGRRAGSWLVGPTHTGWKLAGILAMSATLVATFYRTTYRIGAPMELRPREIRTISVPFDGVLWTLAPGVEHGKVVGAGELLAELDTTQLRLSLVEAQSQRLQYDKEADEAMKRGEQGVAQQALAKVKQAEARMAQVASRIEQARLTSPIAGTIVSGDIKDRVRSSLKLGDPLFQIADLGELIAVVRVEDRDISLVHEGQGGEISPKSDPSLAVPVEVERIVPMAKAGGGSNQFEVHARIRAGEGVPRLLPGVEGQARLDGPRQSLLWIASRRIVDQVRMWVWW